MLVSCQCWYCVNDGTVPIIGHVNDGTVSMLVSCKCWHCVNDGTVSMLALPLTMQLCLPWKCQNLELGTYNVCSVPKLALCRCCHISFSNTLGR